MLDLLSVFGVADIVFCDGLLEEVMVELVACLGYGQAAAIFVQNFYFEIVEIVRAVAENASGYWE